MTGRNQLIVGIGSTSATGFNWFGSCWEVVVAIKDVGCRALWSNRKSLKIEVAIAIRMELCKGSLQLHNAPNTTAFCKEESPIISRLSCMVF